MKFWSEEVARTFYICQEYAITAQFDHLFLLNLALKTSSCVMTGLIKFPALYIVDEVLIENRRLQYM